ncbi:DUF1643 domain-containing protein [Oceanobacillus caeni]|uniref:DUF1643 domain-containing protein n=1 Tax=Oceanobacillus caeni TaxID=405946 RepID=UPI003630C297
MAESYPTYVKTPTDCKTIKIKGTEIRSRRYLKAELKNKYHNKILFILMNPSKAGKTISDKTINKCAHTAFYDLSELKIGHFSIVNVYPFYESNSSKLQEALVTVRNTSMRFYYKELIENLKTIYSEIENADYIVLCTGGMPDKIIDKEEYLFLVNTIHSYAETLKETVYLGKGDNNKGFIKGGRYSYHLCPNENPRTINKLKLHKLENGQFREISPENIFTLTNPL